MAGPNYWWVNHKQTFRSETEGGYIWSPKTNSNGARNQTYDNLLKVQPGDVVVSYADAKIKVVGIATGSCREAPKPEEFGSAGASWSNVGWLVPIEWTSLSKPISPKEHIERIAPMLPPKNSPLQPNGNGNQGCYLASISPELGKLILSLASHEGLCLELELDGIADDIKSDLALQEVQDAVDISETEKEQLVRSRRGQGLFDSECLLKNRAAGLRASRSRACFSPAISSHGRIAIMPSAWTVLTDSCSPPTSTNCSTKAGSHSGMMAACWPQLRRYRSSTHGT